MKKIYIKPIILCYSDIDMSIIAATADTETLNGADDGHKGSYVPVDGSGDGSNPPGSSKGTSWNLWDDEEEYY